MTNTPDRVFPAGRFIPVDEGQRLYVLALAIAEDAVLTYDDIRAALGFDIRDRRGLWKSVADRLQRDHGLVFDAERNVGYRRLKDAAKVDSARDDLQRAHNAARRSLDKSATIKVENLDEQTKTRHNATVSVAAVVWQETAPKALKAQDHGQPPPRPLPLADLIRVGHALR